MRARRALPTTPALLATMATLATLAMLSLAAGCGRAGEPTTATSAGSQASAADHELAPATLLPGKPVPAPAQKPLLTVTGLVGTTNAGSELHFDLALLEQLAMVEANLYEPWEKSRRTFRGVWLADLLAVAGVPENAKSIRLTALDDYEVDLTMDEIRAGGILLATRREGGSLIPIDEGGPTRIVFLDGTASGANQDQWIWSLETIDVR